MQITCKTNDKVCTIEANIGDDLDAAIALVGAEVVYSHYAGKAKLQALGRMRSMLNDTEKKDGTIVPGADPDEVVKALADWKPSLGPSPKSNVEKLKDLAGQMSKEELTAFIKSMKG